MSEVLLFPLLTGGILLVAGCIQYFFPPKKINGLYGYRTAKSMKSQQHWDRAQPYSAKKLIQVGVVMLLTSPLGLFFNWGENQVVPIFMVLLISGVIYVIFKTEQFLKKIVDDEK